MPFRITGLSPEPFKPLFRLSDAALATQGARRMVVDAFPGFPDRVSLRDVPQGETVLLVNHLSQPAPTPYRASHAVFVWEGAGEAYDRVGEVPEALRRRLLSLRGFDSGGMMRAADVVEGTGIEPMITRLFADEGVAVIHVHHARQGCYAARVERA